VENALADSEARMRTIADTVPALIAHLSIDEKFIFVNGRSRDLYGLPPEAVAGRHVADFLTPEAYAQTRPYMERAKAGERTRFQRTIMREGRECHELVEYIPDRDAQGKVVGIYALVQDVTDLREAQAKVEESARRLRGITDNIPLLIGYIDTERRYRFNSRYYEAWLGRPLSEITGRTVAEVLGPAAWASMGPKLDRAFAGERVDYDLEYTDKTGTRHVRGSYVPDVDEAGRVVGVYTSSHDVTPLKEAEHALERLAQYDALTGLPNRRRFNDGIAAALQRSRRSGIPIALLFLDIDGFKRINDTLGHAAGDEVLREFARRLTSSVRSTDLVARLAGDEFVVVLEGIHGREECRFVARKIIAATRGEFLAGGKPLKVTTSIGIALGQGSSMTAEALLKRADSALYAAKRQGRDRYEIAI
ncbi:MAG TPA: diguanylate cyclase, partial [Casimicrobiaceae bacterium]|nr:diguanylate cyclase [Casimicrobiaceae bacterium]